MDDVSVLMGNVSMTGFRDVDETSLLAIKGILESYFSRTRSIYTNLEELALTLKPVHETPKNLKFEVHARLMDNGKLFTAEITDRDLLFAVDKALSIVESSIKR